MPPPPQPLQVYSRTPDAEAGAGRRPSLDRYFSAVETVEEEEGEGEEGAEEGDEEGAGAASAGAVGAAGAAAGVPAQDAAAAHHPPPAGGLLFGLHRPFSPPRPYSPHGRRHSDSALSPWEAQRVQRAQQRAQMDRQRSRSAGEAHCWAAMPPGFYPGASVEVRSAQLCFAACWVCMRCWIPGRACNRGAPNLTSAVSPAAPRF